MRCTCSCSTSGRSLKSRYRGSVLVHSGKDELVPPSTPRAIATPIERWLRLRLQTTDRAESVRHCRDSFRYFLRWLADTHPEIAALRQLNRTHLEAFLLHLHAHINPRNGQPLS